MISRLGIDASLRAIEDLSTGDAAQRAALANQLEQLDYEAQKAFEQYDTVDARNCLVAAELERRWNEKLQERETVKERLSRLEGTRRALSAEPTAMSPNMVPARSAAMSEKENPLPPRESSISL